MAKNENWYAKLTRIFRSDSAVKRHVRDYRTPRTSSAMQLFSKTQSHTYSNAINAYGAYDRMCVDLQTRIAIPGVEKFKTLAQLIDEHGNTDEKFIVYAYDHTINQIVPAWAHHPRSSGVRETVIVTFDDGNTLTCTPDHPCMLRSGEYRDAGKLQSGDAMMPFYRKQFNGVSKNDGKQFDGYYSVYTMASKDDGAWRGWISEHKLIAEWSSRRRTKKDEHVHHIDFNVANNDHENLQFMNAHEHLAMHGHNSRANWDDPIIREKMLKGLQAAWDNDDGTRRAKVAQVNRCPDVVEMRRQHMLSNNPSQRYDVRTKISASLKKRYEDPIHRKSISDRVKLAHTEGRLKTTKSFSHYWKDKKLSQARCDVRRGSNNHNYRHLTLQEIVDAACKHKFIQHKICKEFQCTSRTLRNRLSLYGFTSWKQFGENYNNHRVVSVAPGPTIEVGDLTVDGFENFATDTIVVHNSRLADYSEMNYSPEISAALDVFADETVSQDEFGRVLHIYSDNRKIRLLLEELFEDTLNINHDLRMWVRNLCQNGDFVLFNDVAPSFGIIQSFPIPINEIEREEGFDPEDAQAVRFRWLTQGNVALENWQITHFRLKGNDAFLPYGTSMIEAARRIWRQLILIEDAMMVYRIVRSPERRVFYIDVGGIPADEISNYMKQQEASLRSSTVIDRTDGRMDYRYAALSQEDDYFIARRGGESLTEVTTLAGGQHVSAIEDVVYLQRKLFAALKIPRAYLGYDEMVGCLTGDTVVALTDGRNVTMEELVREHDAGIRNEVYSYDTKTNRHVAGRIVRAWKTKDVNELCEVVLDDGNVIRCTGNHPFLLRDGTYARADSLEPGHSLMPTYRRASLIAAGQYLDDYMQVFDHTRKSWRYVHRLFGEQKYPNLTKSNVIHHADFNRHNNAMSNLLKFEDQALHRYFHAIQNRVTKKFAGRNNPMFNHRASYEMLVDVASQARSYEELQLLTGYGTRVITRILSENGHTRQSFSDAHMPLATGTYRCKGYDISFEEVDACARSRFSRRESLSYHAVAADMNTSPHVPFSRVMLAGFDSWTSYKDHVMGLDADTLRRHMRDHSSVTAMYKEKYVDTCGITAFNRRIAGLGGAVALRREATCDNNNHKVLEVRRVRCDSVPVYDIEVERWHNFAIVNKDNTMSGIFVHNSKSTLAQEDIRFSRTVQVIQRAVLAELQKMAYIHLYMNGYTDNDMFDFELRLANPSTIAQQQKLELYNRKFEIFGNALSIADGKIFSQQYLLRNLMDMSPQLQRELAEEVIVDIQRRAALDKIASGEISAPSGGGGGGFSSPTLSDAGDSFDSDQDIDLGPSQGDSEPDMGGDTDAEDAGGADEEDLVASRTRRGTIIGEDDDDLDVSGVTLIDDDAEDGEDSDDDNVITINPGSHTTKTQYNRSRKRRHGAAALHTPDFYKMAQITDPQQDPFDSEFIMNTAININPFKDALKIKLESYRSGDPRRAAIMEQLMNIESAELYLATADVKLTRNDPDRRVGYNIRKMFDALEVKFGDQLSEIRHERDEVDNSENDVILEKLGFDVIQRDEFEDDEYAESKNDIITEVIDESLDGDSHM